MPQAYGHQLNKITLHVILRESASGGRLKNPPPAPVLAYGYGFFACLRQTQNDSKVPCRGGTPCPPPVGGHRVPPATVEMNMEATEQ